MKITFLKRTVLLFVCMLIACLFYLQIVQGEYYLKMSQKNRIRVIPLRAPRGNIYDRHMELLAGNRLAFDCAVIPQEFDDSIEVLNKVALMLDMPGGSLKSKIEENALAPFAPTTLKRDLDKELAISISERSLDFPGLLIQTYPVRYYPHGSSSSHITGYIGLINEEELSILKRYGYMIKDYVGRTGLELFYDDYLKGESGGMQVEVDSRGRELEVMGIREPSKGMDITTTLDIRLQEYIDSLLGSHKGAAIVMLSQSGDILAMSSKPDYDPNAFLSPAKFGEVKKLLTGRDCPLINRAISASYPPGSVFKIVTATAALELGRITEDELLDCGGYYVVGNRRFHCWKKSGHGLQTIREGIKNSCNVFFWQTGLKAGVDAISDFGARYGLGRKSSVDLPYETEGVLPGRGWKRRTKGESWYPGDTMNLSIGQGYLLLTPMQVTCMYNALATEGKVFTPHIARSIGGVDVFPQQTDMLKISARTFRAIKDGTKRAVQDAGGTSSKADAEGLDIAGKTGTAETGTDRTHAWFAGYSPADDPLVTVTVFLEYGGKGGGLPCEIASKIFIKLEELGYL